jgi:hypothetical protein
MFFFLFLVWSAKHWRYLYILLEASIQERQLVEAKELILKHDVRKDFYVVDI